MNITCDLLTTAHIDVENLTDRVDELRAERDDLMMDRLEGNTTAEALEAWESENGTELAELETVLRELCGEGGDHQWNGDWYPRELIEEGDTFVDAMRELVQDCYNLKDIPAFLAIDWEETADNLKADYSTITIGKTDYLYR